MTANPVTDELVNTIWEKGIKQGAKPGDSVAGILDKNDKLIKVEVIKKKARASKMRFKKVKVNAQ